MTLKATRRALYRYVCAGCGKKRYSFKYDKASEEQRCRKCPLPNPNQATLFNIKVIPDPDKEIKPFVEN